MRLRLFVAALMLCGVCGAQVVMEQQMQMSRVGQGNEPAKPKPTPEQMRRGRQMLETAEASAYGMEGGMRAYALLQVAAGYTTTDKKKALELLDNALAATKGMDDDQAQTRNRLQEQILQAIVPLKPEKADELLNQVDPSARGRVLTSLLSYYQKNNDWDRAIEVVFWHRPRAGSAVRRSDSHNRQSAGRPLGRPYPVILHRADQLQVIRQRRAGAA